MVLYMNPLWNGVYNPLSLKGFLFVYKSLCVYFFNQNNYTDNNMFHNQKSFDKMAEKQNSVVGSMKKPYEKPEIEVIDLDNQAPLLSASPYGAGFRGIDDEDM